MHRTAIQQAINEEIARMIGGELKTFKANDFDELEGTFWVFGKHVAHGGCPNFSGSLDAMSRAETTLTQKEQKQYISALESFAKTVKIPAPLLPAELRARAFVLVKG